MEILNKALEQVTRGVGKGFLDLMSWGWFFFGLAFWSMELTTWYHKSIGQELRSKETEVEAVSGNRQLAISNYLR